jgi:tripartite ATP-independent transporter DctM subunit
MEWWLVLLLIFGGLLLLLASGMPVAFAFMLVNLIGVIFIWGGEPGLRQLIFSIFGSITKFTLVAAPLFILMGEVLFHSGVALRAVDTLDVWVGRLPGRLSLLAVAGGSLLAAVTGASFASVSVMSSTMLPEMIRRGYKKPMALGPILGSGGLAIMIPPSALAVILAIFANISIGKFLIAIIIPGLLMGLLYASYIIIRCWLQPSLAPPYKVTHKTLSEKLINTVKYVFPLGIIIFLVIGVIFLGIATPSESAASGALASFILAVSYKRLTWEVVKKSTLGTIHISTMVLTIMLAATAFSQILAFSGASTGLLDLVKRLPLIPILILIAMQVIVIILAMFMEQVSIMMVTLPIYMPIVHNVGFDPVWFSVLFLLNMEMGATSPPFGLLLFVMKGMAPPGTTTADIWKAGIPFLLCDLIAMALIIAFPAIALWLPGKMR